LTSHTAQTVVTRRQGRIGRITLNRPKALNAIDRDMIRTIYGALNAWHDDPAVHAVVIEGAGGRAFCAGGDIYWVRQMAIADRHAEIEAFFIDEYALNLAIARYPKPYVALIDGVCMGGGIGLSVHGSIRVASESASLAMPETAIGFFPDVGASFILPRLRASFGMYLGLSGSRIDGAAATYIGLATHYVPHDQISMLADDIAKDGVAVLAEVAIPPPHSAMADLTAVVRCFEAGSVADILAALEILDSDKARKTQATLRAMSPSSLLWSHELLRLGANQSLEQCLQTELMLTRHATRFPDFSEGVRAMVVDKDRTPRWSPSRIEDVNVGAIKGLFL
jgi:enoyl-CoA hydratase